MSHSSSFERWLISPVWTRNAGCVGIALILSIASVSVARGSGFGGRWKPIWLSLICTKVSSPCGASAAAAPPIRPSVRGTPPLSVHTTPVPAQVMHFNKPRRLMFGPLSNSFSSRSAISVSLLAWGATQIQTAIPTGLFPRLVCPPAPHSLRQHRLECVLAAPRDEAQSGRREGARLSRVLSGAASRAGGPDRLAPVVGRGRARSPGRRERNSLIFGRCEIDREGRHEDRVQGEQGQPMEEPDHRVKTCSSGSPSVRSISIPHCHALAGWPGGEIESGARLFPRPLTRVLNSVVIGWHGYERARIDTRDC